MRIHSGRTSTALGLMRLSICQLAASMAEDTYIGQVHCWRFAGRSSSRSARVIEIHCLLTYRQLVAKCHKNCVCAVLNRRIEAPLPQFGRLVRSNTVNDEQRAVPLNPQTCTPHNIKTTLVYTQPQYSVSAVSAGRLATPNTPE
jgi:hypothetical protein